MAERVSHEGTCPYCKEQIKPDAIRCKHCHADLARGQYVGRRGRSALGTRRAVPHGSRLEDASRLLPWDPSRGRTGEPELASDAGQCPPLDSDDEGIWTLKGSTETECIYELVVEWRHYGVFRDGEFINPPG